MDIDYKKALTILEKTVNHFISVSPYLLTRFSKEDLVQEVICHFLEKKFLEKYDETITSFDYFVAKAAKNHLIDLTRKRIILPDSLNRKVGSDEGGSELGDLIEDNIEDSELSIMLTELYANVSKERVSPNYGLTWRELLGYVLIGKTPKEISAEVVVTTKAGTRNLSVGRVSQLIAQLRSMCEVYV